MFANEDSNLAFVHIPKNAGTSVRNQFVDFDDFEGRFSGRKMHPGFGEYDANHVPLDALRRYFPDAFAKIAALQTFALVRDPFLRFVSALGQRVHMFRDGTASDLSKAQLHAEIDDVIGRIGRAGPFLPRNLAHFMRQDIFVDTDGKRFVDVVLPIESTPWLIAEFGRRLGVRPQPASHENTAAQHETNRVVSVLRTFRPIYSRLPAPVIERLRHRVAASLTRKQNDRRTDEIMSSKVVRDFIETYYAKDIDLHREVTAGEAGARHAY
jgi:hypothetical protein